MDSNKPEPRGLGGWLILVGIGLLITIVSNVRYSSEIFSHWGEIMPMAEVLLPSPWFKTAYGLALGFMVLTTLFYMYLAILFFRQKKCFPRMYIIGRVVGLLGTVLILFILSQASGENFFDEEAMRGLLGGLIGAAIWIPYMLYSVRVKNTFVHPGWL